MSRNHRNASISDYTLDHACEYGLALVSLPEYGLYPLVKLRGHLIQGLGKAADFLGLRDRQPVAQFAARKKLGASFQLGKIPARAKGYEKRNGRGKCRYRQPAEDDLRIYAAERIVDGGH